MPKKKPIAKRLNSLFKDITPEQAPADPNLASTKRASVDKTTAKPADLAPGTKSRQPAQLAAVPASNDAGMSLAFQMGQNNWATLQVMDEVEQRKWTQDEQLLVKQVADQLSLALENARLFQETQVRAEELSVLNEMGRELSSQLEIEAISEVVYRYTSRLMNTSNFFVALYDEKVQEKTFPLAFEEGQ